jgi:putative ABC transport system permease protein
VKLIQREGRIGQQAMQLRLVGTTPDWFELVNRPMLEGRPLSALDLDRNANVAVLTEHAARRLFAAARAGLHSQIRIGGTSFTIVGIVQSEATAAGGMQTPDRNTDLYVPITTVRERFGDVQEFRSGGSFSREQVELNQIIVEIRTLDAVETNAAAIDAMLARFHRHSSAYRVNVPLALLRQAEATRRNFNIVLGAIAGISLLVGGIGIMNIMLASVTERTREIGVRRAIGAKQRQIVSQFLIETIVLSTTGGIIGVAIGLFIPWVISRTVAMPTYVTPASVFLALGVSMAVGIIFGIYPAMRAARLDPIEALRHE